MLSRFVVKLARPKPTRTDSYEHFGLERVAQQILTYDHLGDDRMLETSILDCERALSLILPNLLDDPTQGQRWTVLMASCLRLRFERDGMPKDIEDAQQMLGGVIAATTPGNPVHTRAIYELGRVYETLHHYTGLDEYVAQAHGCFGRALDGLEDMKEEVTAMEMILLVSLAWCLNSIPARKANAEALRLCAAVLKETSDTDYAHLLALYGFSCASYARWIMNGQQDRTDLINAQDYARRAVLPSHRLRFRHLRWLATICRERAEAGDGTSYIDESIERSAQAVEIVKERHAPASYDVATILITLGLAYHVRWKTHADPEDLDNAINLHRRALATIPFTPFSARHTLVDCLCDRFQAIGLPKDIEDAFATAEKALEESPEGSGDKMLALINVGRILALRYSHGKEDSDFNGARNALHAAAQSLQASENSPPAMMVFVLELLAKIHDVHYQVRKREDDADLAVRYMDEAFRMRRAHGLLEQEEPSPRSSYGSQVSSSGSEASAEVTTPDTVASPAQGVPFPTTEINVTISRETHSDADSEKRKSREFSPLKPFLARLSLHG